MKAKVIGMAAALLLLGWPAGTARAAVIFDDGAVHDITWTIDRVDVRDDSLGNRTIVNLLSGADIASLYAWDSSEVNFSGGFVGGLYAYATSTVNMSGGNVSLLAALDTSTVDISGGTVSGRVSAQGNSHLTFSGEAVTGNLDAADNSRVVVSGGLIGPGSGSPSRSLLASKSSDVTICGGVFESRLQGIDDAVMRFVGSDLSISRHTVPSLYAWGVELQLTGTLANGDPIDNDLLIWNRCHVFFPPVPEPATLSLLALGGVALLRRRRRGTQARR